MIESSDDQRMVEKDRDREDKEREAAEAADGGVVEPGRLIRVVSTMIPERMMQEGSLSERPDRPKTPSLLSL